VGELRRERGRVAKRERSQRARRRLPAAEHRVHIEREAGVVGRGPRRERRRLGALAVERTDDEEQLGRRIERADADRTVELDAELRQPGVANGNEGTNAGRDLAGNPTGRVTHVEHPGRRAHPRRC
jgi:hypothetical protein